jgi:DNA-binding MarR family transcriptional regulator
MPNNDDLRSEEGKEFPYTDLWSRPGFLIRRLHQLHVAVFLDECDEFDVTPVQYAVLSVLYQKSALDQVSVAAEIGIDRNNAADVLRRLERRGFIERIPSTEDRRAVLNAITSQGSRFVEDAQSSMERAQDRFTSGLDKRERESLIRLLRKVMLDNNDFGRARLKTLQEE